MKKLIVPLLVFVLILVGVSANLNWWNEGNSGFNDITGSNKYTGYSLNMPNGMANTTNSSYEVCNLQSSTYTPLSYYLPGSDTFSDILLFSASQIFVYDRDCTLQQTITAPATIEGGPVINNFDGDSYLDVIVPFDDGIYTYEYTPESAGFVLQQNISNTSISIDDIACPYLLDYCLAWSEGSNKAAYKIDLSAHSITRVENHTASDSNKLTIPNGVSSWEFTTTAFYSPYCMITPGITNHFVCNVYNDYGNIQFTANLGSGSYAPEQLYYGSGYFARLGSAVRLFFSGQGHESASGWYQNEYGVWDTAGTLLVSGKYTYNQIARQVSNWAVGDYNKDGVNEACIFYRPYAGTLYFDCYDGSLTKIVNINVSSDLTYIDNFVMADFNPNSSTLGIGRKDGVYYCDISGCDRWLSTSYLANGTGYPIVYQDGSGLTSPIMVYAGSDTGFILRNINVHAQCPNGYCDMYENPFNCPADCNTNNSIGADIVGEYVGVGNSSNCLTTYEINGFCQLAPYKHSCTYNAQCLSQLCTGGLCAKASLSQNIDSIKDDAVGTDMDSSTILSLIISIGVAVGIALLLGQFLHSSPIPALAALVIFILVFTYFGIHGWVYPFLLIGMWFLIALIGIAVFLLSRG